MISNANIKNFRRKTMTFIKIPIFNSVQNTLLAIIATCLFLGLKSYDEIDVPLSE